MSVNLSVKMIYYTYAYLREDRTPYYIGKGKGNRAYRKHKGEVNLPKDKSRIILLKQNITEEEAFKHEIYMIGVFGRKDLGTGILHNKTNGGEGISGLFISKEHKEKISKSLKGRIFTEEHRKKLSEAGKNKTFSNETRNKIGKSRIGRVPWNKGKKLKPMSEEIRKKMSNSRKGRVVSEETRKKISEATKGRIHTQETKKKLSDINKGKKYPKNREKYYEITFDNNEKIIICGKIKWCKDNGYNTSGLYKVQSKKWKRYKNIVNVESIKLSDVTLILVAH